MAASGGRVRLTEEQIRQRMGVSDGLWVGQVEIDYSQPELGHGSDATVYRCVYESKDAAAKVLHSALLQTVPDAQLAFLQGFGEEGLRLLRLQHENVLRFIGVGQAPNGSPCLVTDLMEESLADYVASRSSVEQDKIVQKLQYLIDVAAGLRYIHQKGLLHRDLKLANVLLSAGRAKIADVGISRSLHPQANLKEQLLTRCPGTPLYMAPEVFPENPQYTNKMDIFSFGIIMLAVANGKAPQTINMATVGRIPEVRRRQADIALLPTCHPLRDLILACLRDDAALRPSAAEVHQRLLEIQQGTGGSQVTAKLDEVLVALQQQAETISAMRGQIHGEIHEIRGDVQEIRGNVQEVCGNVQEVCGNVQESRQQFSRELQELRDEMHTSSVSTAAVGDRHAQAPKVRLPSDISRRQWRSFRSPCDKDLIGRAFLAVHDNKLYAGFTTTDGDVRCYWTRDMQTWEAVDWPPRAKGTHQFYGLASHHGVLYAYCWWSGTVRLLQLVSDAFQLLPEPVDIKSPMIGTMVCRDGCIVILGGQRDGTTTTTSVTYNTANHQYHTTSDVQVRCQDGMPALPTCFTSAVSVEVGDQVLFLGGHHPGTTTPIPILMLSASTDENTWQWQPADRLPKTNETVGATKLGQLVIVGGGRNKTTKNTDTAVYAVDTGTGVTTALPPLLQPRHYPAMAVFNDHLVAMGGLEFGGGKWFNECHCLDLGAQALFDAGCP